uniref:Uncharacterized protein n=1 Tax=Haptolina ericina TaxID=156174 RepID=A0A7S3BXN8_9EUKA
MTDKDWEAIEKEWETPEEKEEYEYRPPKQKGIDMEKLKETKDPKKVKELVAESQVSTGPAMMFATVDYEGCCNKSATEKVTGKWSSLLRSAGMDANLYVIEDDQVLFSSQHGFHAHEIRDFVTKQPECVAVEWNQVRTPGPAETPEWIAKNEVKKAEKEAKKAATEKQKKAEEKAKKKKKKTKKKAAKTEL